MYENFTYGPSHSRHYAIVQVRSKSDKYVAVSMREVPKATLVTTSLWGGKLHLDAPDMETLSLPFHLEGNPVNKVYNIQYVSKLTLVYFSDPLHF